MAKIFQTVVKGSGSGTDYMALNANANASLWDYSNSDITAAIRNYFLYQCKTVKSVSFPNATSIGDSAFYMCSKLAEVVIGTNSSTSICTLSSTSAFSSTVIATSTTDGFIYVADSLVDQYKAATNWSTYASKIKGISELPS